MRGFHFLSFFALGVIAIPTDGGVYDDGAGGFREDYDYEDDGKSIKGVTLPKPLNIGEGVGLPQVAKPIEDLPLAVSTEAPLPLGGEDELVVTASSIITDLPIPRKTLMHAPTLTPSPTTRTTLSKVSRVPITTTSPAYYYIILAATISQTDTSTSYASLSGQATPIPAAPKVGRRVDSPQSTHSASSRAPFETASAKPGPKYYAKSQPNSHSRVLERLDVSFVSNKSPDVIQCSLDWDVGEASDTENRRYQNRILDCPAGYTVLMERIGILPALGIDLTIKKDGRPDVHWVDQNLHEQNGWIMKQDFYNTFKRIFTYTGPKQVVPSESKPLVN